MGVPIQDARALTAARVLGLADLSPQELIFTNNQIWIGALGLRVVQLP